MVIKMCFMGGKTGSLEEYRAKVAGRWPLFAGMIVLGAIAYFTSFFLAPRLIVGDVHQLDFFRGFYVGIGSALILLGILLWVKNRLTLKDEAKLRRQRTEEEDERNQQLAAKSQAVAGICTFLALYLCLLIGSLFNMAAFLVCMILIAVYAVSVLLSLAYFRHNM